MKLTWCHNRLAIANACDAAGAVLSDPNEVAAVLGAAGITHLISCRRYPEFMGLYTVQVLSGIVCLWNPIEDDGEPKPTHWFASSIDFALHALANPRHRVAVCCYHGSNRAPSTALAVLLAQGLPYDTAIKLVRDARPEAELRYANDARAAVKELGYW